ncbi:MAG TPA: LysE family translocator [Hyphomicrobium sp.]|jgi:threonine/homoserine/homoserine lactone efflux protein|nr:LysE family translocator [Hyphomicrobium sp.]
MPALFADLSIAGIPLAFLSIALIVELTPGPNMAYLAALALAEGRRAGFATVIGIAAGLLVVGVLAALGVATFVSESRSLYAALRWAGMLYMLWLSYDIWRGEDHRETEFVAENKSRTTYVGRGFLTNVLNPKAAVFFIAVLPQFIDPEHDTAQQTLKLSIVYAAIATLIHAAIVVLASHARPFFQDAARMTILRRVLAAGLVIVAFWLFWSTAENRPA